MTCGIYCYIDSTNNSIVYIGQSVNMERRHTEHLSLARYNDQPFNAILQNNQDRYVFKQIVHSSRAALNDLEKFFIKQYNPIFNYTSGGDGLGTKLGGFLDFITCELLHDLIDKEVNDVSS